MGKAETSVTYNGVLDAAPSQVVYIEPLALCGTFPFACVVETVWFLGPVRTIIDSSEPTGET